MGFEALATTSLGVANLLGRADGKVSRTEAIANAREIVEATDLPVNADLENGFAHQPAAAAERSGWPPRRASPAARSRIFRATPDPDLRLRSVGGARTGRRRMARSLPVPFVLTARAENLIAAATTWPTPSAA